jgi:hypothetical protein
MATAERLLSGRRIAAGSTAELQPEQSRKEQEVQKAVRPEPGPVEPENPGPSEIDPDKEAKLFLLMEDENELSLVVATECDEVDRILTPGTTMDMVELGPFLGKNLNERCR